MRLSGKTLHRPVPGVRFELIAGTVSFNHNNKQYAYRFTHSRLFFLFLFWSYVDIPLAQGKGEPIIISAGNYGFGNYLRGVLQKFSVSCALVRAKCATKCVTFYINDIKRTASHALFSVINTIQLLSIRAQCYSTSIILYFKKRRLQRIQNKTSDINLKQNHSHFLRCLLVDIIETKNNNQ